MRELIAGGLTEDQARHVLGLLNAKAHTAKAAIGDADREQTIHTPQVLLDAIRTIWPDGAELDPCGSRESLRTAQDVYHLPERDGLWLPWKRTNYTNPPFNDLESGLSKATLEWPAGNATLFLTPVRPVRKWWRKHVFRHPTCYLNGVKFLGYKSIFPQCLAMVGFGVPKAAMVRAFDAAGLGETVCHT